MKQLPIGIQDFKVVRDRNKYFVDKSILIGRILDSNDCGVYLYARPRRFGKSLNLSMIDAFFNIKYKGNTWFDDLEISKHHEHDKYKNAFPVIYIDLKLGDVSDFNKFIEGFNSKLFDIFNDFEYLRHSSKFTDEYKALFARLYAGKKTVTDSELALKTLCSMLKTYHGSKVVVLIDEYDSAVNSITDVNLRREIVSFMKEMLSSLLKGNESLQMGVITGIMQITKENIFSGLNNLIVNNILSKKFDEMFGFTDEEVKQMCADYGHPEKFIEAKEWYDGYRFGDADIYNPWSILNYIYNNFEPAPYWVNTSGNNIIEDLLAHADESVLENLNILGSGGSILHNVKTTLTFDDLARGPNAIYSLMAISGYLKATLNEEGYLLSVPNKELFSVFASIITHAAFDDDGVFDNLSGFSNAVMSNNIPLMERTLYALIVKTLSSRVLDDEHSYQAFIAGMLMSLSGRYRITADFESGKGYYDIMMQNNGGKGCNIIMELKKSKSRNQLEHDAEEAIKQIMSRDYAHGLKGQTVIYGIAFFGKEPHIISDVL